MPAAGDSAARLGPSQRSAARAFSAVAQSLHRVRTVFRPRRPKRAAATGLVFRRRFERAQRAGERERRRASEHADRGEAAVTRFERGPPIAAVVSCSIPCRATARRHVRCHFTQIGQRKRCRVLSSAAPRRRSARSIFARPRRCRVAHRRCSAFTLFGRRAGFAVLLSAARARRSPWTSLKPGHRLRSRRPRRPGRRQPQLPRPSGSRSSRSTPLTRR